MGLQEGLILLGAVVFLLVLLDALRRKRAAARHENDDYDDPEEAERRAQLARELPSLALDGKKTASQQGLDPLFDEIDVFDDDPIPVLRNKQKSAKKTPKPERKTPSRSNRQAKKSAEQAPTDKQARSAMTNKETGLDDQLTEEERAWDKMRRMFSVDPSFATASQLAMETQKKKLQELQEAGYELEASTDFSADDLVEFEHPKTQQVDQLAKPAASQEVRVEQSVQISAEEQERDLRAALLVSLEKSAWGNAEVFLTININAPAERPFIGSHLRQLMDMIGMKLSGNGFYHYIEEIDNHAYLGYSLVNMFSPGSFDPNPDNEFETAGVVLVMALPTTPLPMTIFERMLATAKVMEKNWGAELKDEQRSNLTQQTIEHYRQTIKDFEYQTRVNAKKAGRI